MTTPGLYDDKLSKTRPFSLDEPMFNMSNYYGRWRHFHNIFNPMYSLFPFSDNFLINYSRITQSIFSIGTRSTQTARSTKCRLS